MFWGSNREIVRVKCKVLRREELNSEVQIKIKSQSKSGVSKIQNRNLDFAVTKILWDGLLGYHRDLSVSPRPLELSPPGSGLGVEVPRLKGSGARA